MPSHVKVGAEADKTMAGLTPRTLRLLACSPGTDEDVDLTGLIVQECGDEEREVEGMAGKRKEKMEERRETRMNLTRPVLNRRKRDSGRRGATHCRILLNRVYRY